MENTPEFNDKVKRAQEKIAKMLEEEGLALMPTLTFVETKKLDEHADKKANKIALPKDKIIVP